VASAAVASAAAVAASAAAAHPGAGDDMSFLSEDEKTRIGEAIRHAESGTRGEIVTVVARMSDGYRYIPTLWAALIALTVPGFAHLWHRLESGGWRWPGNEMPAFASLYATQVLVFLGLVVLFQIPRCRLWLVPRSVKRGRAARHAREQFFLQKLHLTADRTGVLIFVSLAEHYVEILVDDGIAAVVDDAEWEAQVADFIAHVRRGEVFTGFERAIEHCREVLWTHFPHDSGKPDELPNRLVEL